jgi:hypothetical protein
MISPSGSGFLLDSPLVPESLTFFTKRGEPLHSLSKKDFSLQRSRDPEEENPFFVPLRKAGGGDQDHGEVFLPFGLLVHPTSEAKIRSLLQKPLEPDASVQAKLQRLIDQLSDEEVKVRQEASEELVAMGVAALKALVRVKEDPEAPPEARARADEVIRQMTLLEALGGQTAWRHLLVLEGLLTYPSAEMVKFAKERLESLLPPDSVKELKGKQVKAWAEWIEANYDRLEWNEDRQVYSLPR